MVLCNLTAVTFHSIQFSNSKGFLGTADDISEQTKSQDFEDNEKPLFLESLVGCVT